jgi:hypothetical protein
MSGHPQTTPRGIIAAKKIQVGADGNSTSVITGNSTGVVVAGGVKVSNARHITANSTAFILTTESALPETDNGAAFTMIQDSTGNVYLAVNQTGTTWYYLNVTTVAPTVG